MTPDRSSHGHAVRSSHGHAVRSSHGHAVRSSHGHAVPKGLRILVAAAGLVLALAGCGLAGEQAPSSFDPSLPCGGAARQLMKGVYADLEARVPTTLAGEAATSRDSGRFCAKETLGTLWDAGISETQFGGAIFQVGDKGAVQTSVFRAPGLTVQLLADEYRTGAQADSRVKVVSATGETVTGRAGFRLNLLNGDSRQAIVVWPSADGAVVQVVVAADVDESVVQEAVAGFR